MWVLYGALGACVAIWLAATFVFRRSGECGPPDPAALAEECGAFGREVWHFARSREHGSPTEGDGRALHDRETLRLYHERLGPRATALFDQAVVAGVADAADELPISDPASPDDVADSSQRFRGYAAALRAPSNGAGARSPLHDEIDELLRSGVALLDGLPTAAPVAKAGDGYRVDLLPAPSHEEQVAEFDGRARALLLDRRPSLLPLYAEGANSFLARSRERRARAQQERGELSNAAKLRQFADDAHRRPALYLEACLEGLSAARNGLGPWARIKRFLGAGLRRWRSARQARR